MREKGYRTASAKALSLALLGAATVLVSACAEVSEPRSPMITPGVLQLSGRPSSFGGEAGGSSGVTWTLTPGDGTIVPREVLTVPDTVDAGKSFTVAVETIGDGGCWRAKRQDVVISDRTVELEPYDEHSGAQTCTMILLYLRHESTLKLDEPGEWLLRVTGRRVTIGESGHEVGVSAEKRIVVR